MVFDLIAYYIGIFFSSEKRFSPLHTNVNGKCPNSSQSRLKRHCSTKWIEDHDALFVFNEFYPAVVGYPDQVLKSRDEEVLGAMFYVKATTKLGFLVSLEVINTTLNFSKPVSKKLQGIKKLF